MALNINDYIVEYGISIMSGVGTELRKTWFGTGIILKLKYLLEFLMTL